MDKLPARIKLFHIKIICNPDYNYIVFFKYSKIENYIKYI